MILWLYMTKTQLLHPQKKLREFAKVSKSAFPLVFHRSFYGIAYAREMAELMDAKTVAIKLHGPDLEVQYELVPVMEARYKGGQAVLEKFISQYPNAQVLELAAGFSLHGAFFAKKYPKIIYTETDYKKETVALKKKLIQTLVKAKPENLYFAQANALRAEELKKILRHADPRRPLLVYNEGLMSYLNEEEKRDLAQNVKRLLLRFGGAWITPDPALSAQRRARLRLFNRGFKNIVKSAERVAGQKYDDHGFLSEHQADEFFLKSGFTLEKFAQPVNLNSFKACGLSRPLIQKITEDIKKYGKVWTLTLAV